MAESNRPTPAISEITKPYWEAVREHILVMQKCADCGYYNYPPKGNCDRCISENLCYERVSGRGKIYSYTVMHVPRVPWFEDKLPYVNIVVELEEQMGLLMITNLLDSDPRELAFGARAEVVFERVNDEITLPHFKLAK